MKKLFQLNLLFVVINVCYTIKRPNIVYVLADDMGFDDVSFRGSSQIPTPNLDSLAYDGIILDQYYVQSICTPSRASLLTGRHPIHLGMQNGVIMAGQPFGVSLKEKLLPQYLKELNYDTHMIGKWHIGYFKESYTPTRRGFDSYYGYLQGAETYYSHNCSEEGYSGLDWWRGTKAVYNEDGLYSTEAFTKRAEKIIEQHNTEKPLFLYVAQQATHASTGVPQMEPAPKRYLDKFSYIQNKKRRLFAGMLAALDDSVGNITKALHNKGMLENTIFVFSTDNGGAAAGINGNEACNWPLRGAKYLNWEGGVRGVGFLWSPLLKNTGYVSNQLMHLIDWLPTLLHGAGYNMSSLPASLDGIDYWETLSNRVSGKYTLRNSLVLNIDNVSKTMAIREGDIKLIKGVSGWNRFSGWYPPPQVVANDNDTLQQATFQYDQSNLLLNQAVNEELNSPESYQPSTSEIDGQLRLLDQYQYYSQQLYSDLYKKSTVRRALDEIGRPFRKPSPAVIDCKIPKPANASSNCNLKKAPCLYNVASDPCEYINLAPTHPKLLRFMLEKLDEYSKTVVPARNKPLDKDSVPSKHNGTWAPWMKGDWGYGFDFNLNSIDHERLFL